MKAKLNSEINEEKMVKLSVLHISSGKTSSGSHTDFERFRNISTKFGGQLQIWLITFEKKKLTSDFYESTAADS